MEKAYYGSQEVEVLQRTTNLVQISGEKGPFWVKKDEISNSPIKAKSAGKPRISGWQVPEKRVEVLKRLVNNPSAYVVAAWLLRNGAHVHLSLSTKANERGELMSFVQSEVTDIRDADVSVASELTQGSTFTVTVNGLRPPPEVLEDFKRVGITPSPYYTDGTTVQKRGFVYDFFIVELGVGFNHGTDLAKIADGIKNPDCREAFLREAGRV